MSTKQTNKRVAEQIEAAHKTSLAVWRGKSAFGDRKPAATIRQFATTDFLPFCRSTFAAKIKTLSYYENGTARLLEYSAVANESLDTITSEAITGYARYRREAGMKITTVNRELQVLRRMFTLAIEWRKVERALPKVRTLPGEAHRDRVVTASEEKAYFDAAQLIGFNVLAMYERALEGIRATQRGETPLKPRDPFLLRDVSTILADCGVRPEECFRLKWRTSGRRRDRNHAREDEKRPAASPTFRSRRFDSEFAAGRVPGRLGFPRTDEKPSYRTV